jgi:hypothetical protein
MVRRSKETAAREVETALFAVPNFVKCADAFAVSVSLQPEAKIDTEVLIFVRDFDGHLMLVCFKHRTTMGEAGSHDASRDQTDDENARA